MPLQGTAADGFSSTLQSSSLHAIASQLAIWLTRTHEQPYPLTPPQPHLNLLRIGEHLQACKDRWESATDRRYHSPCRFRPSLCMRHRVTGRASLAAADRGGLASVGQLRPVGGSSIPAARSDARSFFRCCATTYRALGQRLERSAST
jgi:hypothetical protein